MCERLTQNLRILIRQTSSLDVITRVLIATNIGVTNTEATQLIKLVVLPHPRETNAVVNLAHLTQGV